MDTRVRTRSVPFSMSLQARNYPDYPESWSSGTYSKGVVTSVSESMTSYRGPRRRGAVNPMTHFKVSLAQIPFQGSREDANHIVRRKYSGSYGFSVSAWQLPSITSVEAKAVVDEILGGMPTQISLPNFILELPEALVLHHGIKEIFSQKLDKGLSNGVLLGSFGIAPLIGDLQTLWNLSGTINAKIKELQESATKEKWIKFRKGLPCKGSMSVTFSDALPAETLYSHVRMEVIGEKKNVFGLPSSADIFSMWADATGFSRPLAVAWEAIPFSFVADWFFPLGDHLESMGSAYVQRPWIFRNVCTSVKAVACTQVRLPDNFNDVAGLGWSGGRGPVIGAATIQYHNRAPGFPVLPPSGFLSHRFGLKQAGLATALLGQAL